MKKIIPVLVILLILGVGGYFYMKSKNIPPKTLTETGGNAAGSNSVFTSIKDALSKSMSLKCVYKDEQGEQTTTYIKGGAVRVLTEGVKEKEQPNSIILKDKKMYMWNETSKTGFVYMITEPKISPSQENGKIPEATNGKDSSLLSEIEKYKNSCKVEVIDDSFFAPPTDVKFQDMSAFTENLMKQIPTTNPKGDLPVDAQKNLEELMRQITPEAGSEQ